MLHTEKKADHLVIDVLGTEVNDSDRTVGRVDGSAAMSAFLVSCLHAPKERAHQWLQWQTPAAGPVALPTSTSDVISKSHVTDLHLQAQATE